MFTKLTSLRWRSMQTRLLFKLSVHEAYSSNGTFSLPSCKLWHNWTSKMLSHRSLSSTLSRLWPTLLLWGSSECSTSKRSSLLTLSLSLWKTLHRVLLRLAMRTQVRLLTPRIRYLSSLISPKGQLTMRLSLTKFRSRERPDFRPSLWLLKVILWLSETRQAKYSISLI